MNNQLRLLEELQEVATVKFKSKYQEWKFKNNYRKADECSDIRCENCTHCMCHRTRTSKYYKCELLGFSFCSATDIRLSNVCDNFEIISDTNC